MSEISLIRYNKLLNPEGIVKDLEDLLSNVYYNARVKGDIPAEMHKESLSKYHKYAHNELLIFKDKMPQEDIIYIIDYNHIGRDHKFRWLMSNHEPNIICYRLYCKAPKPKLILTKDPYS